MTTWKVYPPTNGDEAMAVHQSGAVVFLTLWRFIPWVFRAVWAGDRIEVVSSRESAP